MNIREMAMRRLDEIEYELDDIRALFARTTKQLQAVTRKNPVVKAGKTGSKPITKRVVSPDGKRRIAAAARKRWIAYRKAKAAAAIQKAAKKK